MMLCPVCKKEYSVEDIGNHFDQCLASISADAKECLPRAKRSFPFEETNKTNLPKKYKTNSEIRTTNIHQKPTMSSKDHISLAEKMRPTNLTNYIGQKQVVGTDTVLRQLFNKGHIPNMVLWGPPGCGKSSLANVISFLAKEIYKDKVHIVKLSAISSGVSNIRDAVNAAKNGAKFNHQTIVFMDEIHRFNKLQQDIFLPHVEAGTFTLIGTTTENPSYSLNSALLSRCRVFVLNKLTISDVMEILSNAVQLINGKIQDLQETKLENSTSKANFIIDKTVIEWLSEVCDGDARVALNGLDIAVKTKVSSTSNTSRNRHVTIILEDIKEGLKQAHTLSDKQTHHSHNLYSALHKSIKAGNANASLYWLARIMAVKEDPVDMARRLVRISSEEIGLADPDALGIAVHTMHGCQMIGMPECDVLLGQCVVYLARAPKSRLMYNALKSAEKLIIEHKGPQPAVPMHIRCRSGEGKLQASLGRNKQNLLRKEEYSGSRLPIGLADANFFQQDC